MTYQVRELTTRRYRGKPPAPIRGPEDALHVLRPRFKNQQREILLVVLLNARHEVLGVETVSVGSLNASIVHPREVFKPAIVQSAASVVLAHNHPSGDPEPSEEDLTITKRLVEVGELLGIGVLDHAKIAGVVSDYVKPGSPDDIVGQYTLFARPEDRYLAGETIWLRDTGRGSGILVKVETIDVPNARVAAVR